MLCILSTIGVMETRFWPLSGYGTGISRETFVFKHFFLCGSSVHMRDLSSQLFQNFDLHVAGKIKICFQTITLKGVSFTIIIYRGWNF